MPTAKTDADRAVGTTSAVPPHQLNVYHRNPRQGDVAAIAASLKAHGQYKPIVVNIGTATGRHNEVLAGNHTLRAFRDLAEKHPDDPRWATVLVHWVNVDDDMASRIVVADNRTSELGGYDTAVLAELLEGMGGDLAGLGFSTADVDDLRAMMEESAELDLSSLYGGDTTSSNGTIVDEGPRTGPDGLIRARDLDETASTYADSATRMIVLPLPILQFIWAQEKLAALRLERKLESNSDLLLNLLAQITGDTPPAEETTAPTMDVE